MRNLFSLGTLAVLLFSSCTIGRMVVFQFSDIRDYKRFPDRPLASSTEPFRLEYGDTAAFNALDLRLYADGEAKYPLDQLNAEHKTVAFLVIQNGKILHERYHQGYVETSWIASFSMAKSYISALTGIAIQEGHIGSERDRVAQYIPELAARFPELTIRHLLQMTAGIKHAENYFNPFAGVAKSYYGRGLRRQVARLKPEYDPGTQFHYQSISTQVLGQVVANATGRTLTDYLQEKIWDPLQMEHPASWSIDQRRKGMEKAFCCINATARDFAKFGLLYLNRGQWQGRSVVPEEWVRKSTAIDAAENAWDGYQYQWWIVSKNGDYTAEGHLGQFIYIYPDKDLVIVRLGKNYGGVYWKETFREIAAQL
ncbi:MAG: serine hydrolase [Bacteroidota bacterium]